MDSLKPNPIPKKSKLSKTFHKITHLKKPKTLSEESKPTKNIPFCLSKTNENKPNCFPKNSTETEETKKETRPGMEALIATIFATVSSLKAAYAELQLAQFPYDLDSVQSADEALVRELKTLSELKKSFLRKRFDLSPTHVTLLLAEIQEQQSLMKMYEITMKKMQNELKTKESEALGMREKIEKAVSDNKLLEKTINSSGQFSVLDCVKVSEEGGFNPSDFSVILNFTVRSIRSFVKLMVKEMESSGWDIEAAAKSIYSSVVFPKSNHFCFVFESFVCREMFDGFDKKDFGIVKENVTKDSAFIEGFTNLKSINPVHFLKMFPDSGFSEFIRAKYLRLVHPKMETSFSGNLNQRKLVISGGVPDTAFFSAFAEVAKRVWLLHCLAFSSGEEVGVFRVESGCRLSEVYMESVSDDAFADVAFTVVPGFRIGKTVVQSQVYLNPAKRSTRR